MRRLASACVGSELRVSLLGALTATMACLALGTSTGCHSASPSGWASPQPATASAGEAAPLSGANAQSAEARPGLGTVWGERRHSPVRNVSFERSSDGPAFLASLLYNDSDGVDALRTRLGQRWRSDEPVFRGLGGAGRRGGMWGGVVIRVTDSDGQPLPAYHMDERVLLIGEAGQRYAIEIANHTSQRFEIVASVDGLDVVDGRAASLDKHGYVLAPHGQLRIDGYRRNMEEVAAFRFGSVRDAYATQTADFADRHVGVIGVALFMERGAERVEFPSRRTSRELDDDAARRELADPFPGRFAQPPPAVDYDN